MCYKYLCIALFIWSSQWIRAQDAGIQAHSLSAGVGLIQSSAPNTETGFNYVLDFTLSFEDNLGSIYFNQGAELGLFNSRQDYLEVSALYGRELKLGSSISLEGHIGVGYIRNHFKNSETDFEDITESTIGFPIRLKLLFYTSSRFALGINPNYNFNSFANVGSLDLLFQYKFD